MQREQTRSRSSGASSSSSRNKVYAVVILGGGIAGYTAAVFAGQANLFPACLLEGEQPGGALAQSHSVRNWPGVIDQPGASIVEAIKVQAQANGVEVRSGVATRVHFGRWPRVIEWKDLATDELHVMYAYSVIIATGREPNRLLDVPGEQENFGTGVSTCAICDGGQFRGKTVVVVGGGDGAVAEVDYLANIAATVYLIVRGPALRARITQTRDRVLAKPNVRLLLNSEVTQINGSGSKSSSPFLSSVDVNTQGQSSSSRIAAQGLFEAIGATPRSAFLQNQVKTDANGYIRVYDGQKASVPGVFAAGDVLLSAYALAPKAANDGSIAALQAGEFLQAHRIPLAPAAASASLLSGNSNSNTSSSTSNTSRSSSMGQKTTNALLATSPVLVTPNLLSLAKVRDRSAGRVGDGNNDAGGGGVREIQSAKQLDTLLNPSNNKPVIVDIYAVWCGPCKLLGPMLESFALTELGQQLTIVKLDSEKQELLNQLLAYGRKSDPSFQVAGLPTLSYWQNGKLLHHESGRPSRTELSDTVQRTFDLSSTS